MPTVIRYDGQPVQLPNSSALWSHAGGTFVGVTGELTYFPLPASMSSQFTTVGIYEVPLKYEFRADLVAKELYQSEDYWWLVLWASQIIDPFQLTAGTKIRVLNLPDVLAELQ